MKIQLIDNRDTFIDAAAKGIRVNRFDTCDAFDQYDVTVICFQDSSLWKSDHDKNDASLFQNDFSTVAQAMRAAHSCKVLVLLPQNVRYNYNWSFGAKRYLSHTRLKDMPKRLASIMRGFFPSNIELIAGASTTEVSELTLRSDFSLIPLPESIYSTLLSSGANTITMLSLNGVVYSTLGISECSELIALTNAAFPTQTEESSIPDWLEQIEFLDEGKIRGDIRQAGEEIQLLEKSMEEKNRILAGYNTIKSILCTKGDRLQETIVGMLREILADDIEFVDDHKEDYRYENDDHIFLFEVKGSRKGLKRQHISDAFHHVQKTKDDLEEADDSRAVKGCLIFSEFIETPPSERDPYADDTIAIARQLDIALLSAKTFLRIYERFKEEALTREDFLCMVREYFGEVDIG